MSFHESVSGSVSSQLRDWGGEGPETAAVMTFSQQVTEQHVIFLQEQLAHGEEEEA